MALHTLPKDIQQYVYRLLQRMILNELHVELKSFAHDVEVDNMGSYILAKIDGMPDLCPSDDP